MTSAVTGSTGVSPEMSLSRDTLHIMLSHLGERENSILVNKTWQKATHKGNQEILRSWARNSDFSDTLHQWLQQASEERFDKSEMNAFINGLPSTICTGIMRELLPRVEAMREKRDRELVQFFELVAPKLHEAAYPLFKGGEWNPSIPQSIHAKALRIRTWMDENQTELDKVTVIKLSSCEPKLTGIPREIGKFRKLTDLWLDFNEITALPKEIGQLKDLTTLKLEFNQLTDLPMEMEQLENLSNLHINRNQFTAIPEVIGRLNHLSGFDFYSNPTPAPLPPRIGMYVNVLALVERHNALSTPDARLVLDQIQTRLYSRQYLHADLAADLPFLYTMHLHCEPTVFQETKKHFFNPELFLLGS